MIYCRTQSTCHSAFLTVLLRYVQPNNIQKDDNQIIINDYQSLSETELDNIIGRTYTTRGLKRSYVEDSISIEPPRNIYRRIKQMKDKRDLLHLKDTYHLTDSAFNAVVNFIRRTKDINIRIRLGGDLMNAVYVFGLAGFSSNYPCIFCTQHKDDLHVTEDTAYDKAVTEGKGKNKKTITVHIGPTSYHDIAKGARSLFEQASCLAKNTNELGYKCEPLFSDLFNYQDYCIDTLHMKLRIFDVILKDILSYASRTGKYGSEHLAVIEEKIRILNEHCEKTVGKRFFFQIDSDDKNKTIASHGKLSGHLQDLFFVDSFPYNDILSDEIAKAARSVVNKFKEILRELSHNTVKQKGVLKKLSLEFVKEFRQSGLRTTVTPYIHIVGNHLFEFHEFNNIGDFNMQGVEKNNDVLSRLYFSSTNPAKNPLLTMLQKLYRMLEMNFQDEKERDAMGKFAHTGVYDFVEENMSELESDIEDHSILPRNKQDNTESEEENEGQSDLSISENEEENQDETESDESLVWAPENRFGTPILPRTQNRFKSFRRS
ncbi:unnamed protein product [Rotaria sordida]|uniref:Uncharacterized protein n=2 Tax=Rotaria sordida TaxID=392033 RepID=A0A815A836_9BILA|nr:unnamed protein product [Rotaria sordida]